MALLILLAPGRQLFGQSDAAVAFIQNGDRLSDQKKYREALAEYQKALSVDPDNQYAKFQIDQIQNKVGMGAGQDRYETLPPRDYSKINFSLGPAYKDSSDNFSIRYPAGWTVDSADPNFSVKFTEPYSEVFIFIKVIPTSDPVLVNFQFRDQVENQIKKIIPQVPGANLKYCNFDKFQNDTSLRTEILFKTGPNRSIITTRYISDITRIFMVSWVCQEKLFYTFRPWAESSIATLNLHPH
jgi:tetratricopeptide (TPR) repeat protein